MLEITHLNCGWLHKPPLPPACCHCLMMRTDDGVVLIDSGIGAHDVADPEGRIGREAIDAMGFRFHPSTTAVRQLESLGIGAADVKHIVLTHCDSDHVGGLSDFPDAEVHLSAEEKQSVDRGDPRYTPKQFSHGPRWRAYGENDSDFLGLPARTVSTELQLDLQLVPLPGHTAGHCGVAVGDVGMWWLHVGDAYYLRGELANEDHPIGELASFAAVDNEQRLRSLEALRRLTAQDHSDLRYFGYHDVAELPADIPRLHEVS